MVIEFVFLYVWKCFIHTIQTQIHKAHLISKAKEPGLVTRTCNPSTHTTEAGETQVRDQSGLPSLEIPKKIILLEFSVSKLISWTNESFLWGWGSVIAINSLQTWCSQKILRETVALFITKSPQ